MTPDAVTAIVVAVIALVSAGLGYIAKPVGDYFLERGRDTRRREEESAERKRERLVDLQAAMQETVAHCYAAEAAMFNDDRDAAVLRARQSAARVTALRSVAGDGDLRTDVGALLITIEGWTRREKSIGEVAREYEAASDRVGELLGRM